MDQFNINVRLARLENNFNRFYNKTYASLIRRKDKKVRSFEKSYQLFKQAIKMYKKNKGTFAAIGKIHQHGNMLIGLSLPEIIKLRYMLRKKKGRTKSKFDIKNQG
jgi:hypothetical protein